MVQRRCAHVGTNTVGRFEYCPGQRVRRCDMAPDAALSCVRWCGESTCIHQVLAHYPAHADILRRKTQPGIELLRIIGSEIDVLARQLFERQLDHTPCDAALAICAERPNVHHVGIAHAIRQDTYRADHATGQ